MQRWKPFQKDVRCEVEIVLKANYVQVNNEQPAGVVMDEEVRKEFQGFWERYESDPFAGLWLRVESGHLLVAFHSAVEHAVCDWGQPYTLHNAMTEFTG